MPTRYRKELSGLTILVMLAGCASHSPQDNDVAGAGTSSGGMPNADVVFDQGNADPNTGLGALDLERMGLGNQWNALDQDGDGRISRQEFRRRFDDPAITRQLQMKAQTAEVTDPEQTVSSSWRLPPEPTSRQWRSQEAAAPATLSTPSAAAWGVSPAPDEPEATDPRREETITTP